MANQHSTITASRIAAELASASEGELPALIERYACDPRRQVVQAVERAKRRLERMEHECERVQALYEAMATFGGQGVVVGVDEVGRGAVAGPLTVCAVCLPAEPQILGLNDSKKLSPERRRVLAERIAEVARAIGIYHVLAADIDRMGMAQALRVAVAGAVADTGLDPDCVLMDGNPLGAVEHERDIVHGDARVACIAAASIVAKVTRDDLMVDLAADYPAYPFAQCKGYASPEHIAAIRAHGLSDQHRVSFCGNFLETEPLF